MVTAMGSEEHPAVALHRASARRTDGLCDHGMHSAMVQGDDGVCAVGALAVPIQLRRIDDNAEQGGEGGGEPRSASVRTEGRHSTALHRDVVLQCSGTGTSTSARGAQPQSAN